MPHLHEYQQRVVDEKAALDEKIEKLGQFLQGATYLKLVVAEQERLKRQWHYMKNYAGVLNERIEAFKGT